MSLPNYPKCADNCVVMAYAQAGCRYPDYTCPCTTGATVFNTRLSQCVYRACPKVDADNTMKVNSDYCASVNNKNKPAPVAVTPAPVVSNTPAATPSSTTTSTSLIPAPISTSASSTPVGSVHAAPTPKSSIVVTANNARISLSTVAGGTYTTTLLASGTSGPTIQTTAIVFATSTPKPHRGLSPGVAAGVGVGATIGILLLLTCLLFFVGKYKKQKCEVRRLGSMITAPMSQDQMVHARAAVTDRGIRSGVDPNQNHEQHQNPFADPPDRGEPPGFHHVNNGEGYYEMETVERKVELYSPVDGEGRNGEREIDWGDERKGAGGGAAKVVTMGRAPFPRFVEVVAGSRRPEGGIVRKPVGGWDREMDARRDSATLGVGDGVSRESTRLGAGDEGGKRTSAVSSAALSSRRGSQSTVGTSILHTNEGLKTFYHVD